MNRLWYIQVSTVGGQPLADLLIEQESPVRAVKLAERDYPGRRCQLICSLPVDVEIRRKPSKARAG